MRSPKLNVLNYRHNPWGVGKRKKLVKGRRKGSLDFTIRGIVTEEEEKNARVRYFAKNVIRACNEFIPCV